MRHAAAGCHDATDVGARLEPAPLDRATLHVVFCANTPYFEPLAVAAVSVAENTRGGPVHIHVLTCDRDADAERRLAASLARYPAVTLHLRHVPTQDLAAASIGGEERSHAGVDQYVTRETYMRILAPEVLPREIERAIYLDCDVVVVDDVRRLWETPLDGATLGAAPDYPLIPYFATAAYREQLGMRRDSTYINPGVMLLDLAAWRRRRCTARVFDYVAERGNSLTFHDQDAINGVLFDETRVLDVRWNLAVRMFRIRRGSYPMEFEASRHARRNPGVLHYSGATKPWLFRSRIARKGDYHRHHLRTAWRETRPELASTGQRLEWSLDRALSMVGIDYLQVLYLARRAPEKLWAWGRGGGRSGATVNEGGQGDETAVSN